MIFHEIYSVYYQAVAKILERAQQGQVSHEELGQIVSQTAFAESAMTILPALQKGQWQLLTPDGKTPIVHRPTMPLTLLQKQWLKALTLDPRFRLFGIELPVWRILRLCLPRRILWSMTATETEIPMRMRAILHASA